MQLGANGACCGLPSGKRHNLWTRSSGSRKMTKKRMRKGGSPDASPAWHNSQLRASFTPSPCPLRLHVRLCKHLFLIPFTVECKGVCLPPELPPPAPTTLFYASSHLLEAVHRSPSALTFPAHLLPAGHRQWHLRLLPALRADFHGYPDALPCQASVDFQENFLPDSHLILPQNTKHGPISSGPPNQTFFRVRKQQVGSPEVDKPTKVKQGEENTFAQST